MRLKNEEIFSHQPCCNSFFISSFLIWYLSFIMSRGYQDSLTNQRQSERLLVVVSGSKWIWKGLAILYWKSRYPSLFNTKFLSKYPPIGITNACIQADCNLLSTSCSSIIAFQRCCIISTTPTSFNEVGLIIALRLESSSFPLSVCIMGIIILYLSEGFLNLSLYTIAEAVHESLLAYRIHSSDFSTESANASKLALYNFFTFKQIFLLSIFIFLVSSNYCDPHLLLPLLLSSHANLSSLLVH